MKRAFKMKQAFFIIFKGLSVAKNCVRLESAPLSLGFGFHTIYPPSSCNFRQIDNMK